MPQLDRILSRLDGGAASEVVLEADAPIRCVTPSGLQAVTQQLLSRQQVLALVAEIASPADRASVNTGVNVRVQCALNGNSYAFTQDDASPRSELWRVVQLLHRLSLRGPRVRPRVHRRLQPAKWVPEKRVGNVEYGGVVRPINYWVPSQLLQKQRKRWSGCCDCR